MTIRAVENFLQIGLDTSKAAFLLLEVDGEAWEVEQQLEQVIAICKENEAVQIEVAHAAQERAALWKARKSISGACGKINPTKIGEDIAVPPAAIPAMIKAVKEIAQKYNLNMVVFGHAGDGNLHIYCCSNTMTREEFIPKVKVIMDKCYAKCTEFEGQVSGEHAIGHAKKRYLRLSAGETASGLMDAIKQVFDPNGILNPGKVCTNVEEG